MHTHTHTHRNSKDLTEAETSLCRPRSVQGLLAFLVVMYGCEIWTIKKAESVTLIQSCPILCDLWTEACQAPMSM